jgi:PAS domain S-box-containing protein
LVLEDVESRSSAADLEIMDGVENRNRAPASATRTSQAELVLDHLVASSPIVLVEGLATDRFEFTYMSPNAQWILGYHPTELVGDSGQWMDKVHPDDRDDFLETLARAIDSGCMQLEMEFRLLGSDLDCRWVSCVFGIDRSHGDGPAIVVGYLLDVSEVRKTITQLKQRERTLDAVIDASADVIALFDMAGELTLVSPALGRLLGLDITATDAESLAQWIHPDDVDEVARANATLYSGEADEVAFRHRSQHADGRVLMMEGNARLMIGSDGAPSGVVVVSRDVTDHFELEQRLVAARHEAERANRAKSEFLSRMSHELRTPLNAVLGFAQLLNANCTNEEDLDCVGPILTAGEHLLTLINEVLDISRIECGRIEVSTSSVELADVLDEAFELISPMVQASSLRLRRPASDGVRGLRVSADRQRLLQILLNLLSNAVKYNRPGGSISIEISIELDSSSVRISVIDTGIGIDPEMFDRLFTPFDRLGAEATGVEGTGLGLALSRRLAEEMGGRLEATSSAAIGSTFALDIELADAAPDAPAPAACPERTDQTCSIAQ